MRMPGYAMTVISGNVTGKPRPGKYKNGNDFAVFDVAVNSSFFAKEAQEWRNRTTYLSILVRRPYLVQRVLNGSIDKGTAVLIQATPVPRVATGPDGRAVVTGMFFAADMIRVGRDRNPVAPAAPAPVKDKMQDDIPDLDKAPTTDPKAIENDDNFADMFDDDDEAEGTRVPF